jgi:hypothetical protein
VRTSRRRTKPEKQVTGLLSYYFAQFSSDSIERLLDLIVMETELVAAASALERHVTANPAERRAALITTIRTANDLYVEGIGRDLGQSSQFPSTTSTKRQSNYLIPYCDYTKPRLIALYRSVYRARLPGN